MTGPQRTETPHIILSHFSGGQNEGKGPLQRSQCRRANHLCQSLVSSAKEPAVTKAWHGVEMQESVSRRLWRCVQQTPPRSLLGSQHLPPSSLMPALPFGGAPPLGRHSADLQVLVSGDVVLELMGFEEVFQLLHVALMQPVHLLLGRMWCLLHFDGLPHCKTQS